jgi:hypothetical protein
VQIAVFFVRRARADQQGQGVPGGQR